MNEYKKFGYYYDEVMSNLNYNLWYEFIKPYLKPESKILDLACGTGTLLNMLALSKYKCDGLDLSESIIEIAKEKAKINRLHINYYVDDMTSFNLEDKYDIVTCFFDSLNFLPSFNDVIKTASQAHKHLNHNGYFIIDFFSLELLKEYDNSLIEQDYETFKIKWETKLTGKTSLRHKINIKDFENDFTETYDEYYYELEKFNFDGFKLIKISGDFNDDYLEEDERILLVFQKI